MPCLSSGASTRNRATPEKVKGNQRGIAGVNTQLVDSIAKANELYATMGGESGCCHRAEQRTRSPSKACRQRCPASRFTPSGRCKNIFNMLDGVSSNMFDAFAQGSRTVRCGGCPGDAFRQFAANFLMEIAKMIIKQALFNTCSGFRKPHWRSVQPVFCTRAGSWARRVSGLARGTSARHSSSGDHAVSLGGIAGQKSSTRCTQS